MLKLKFFSIHHIFYEKLEELILKSVLIALLLILSLAVINVWSLETNVWTSFAGIDTPAPAKTHIVENNNSIIVEMNLDGINVEERMKEGKRFQCLSVPNTDWTSEIGKPKLPVVRAIVKIPSDGSVTIKAENEEHIILPNYNVYPVGKQIVKNGRRGTVYLDEEFTIDKGFYSTDSIYPQELANISFSGHLRDERIVQLEFHPIRYNPSSQELFCYSYLRVRLMYEGTSRIMKPSGLLGNDLKENTSMAPGYTAMGSISYPEDLTTSHNADYIIIAPEPFYSDPKLRQFAEWRSQYSGLD
ncbi:MAG: hypothetical protein QG641_620, partial [Candidatus Poribacteria bacterium]|nr:hypothetical protein [Candidatus Poribacteria bacterium]